jgi:hypothetical protein
MKDVFIDNSQPWKRTHWRTIRTAYRRAPFFEHYEDSLQALFEQAFSRLADFNLATVLWLRAALGLDFAELESAAYAQEPPDALDLRDEQLRQMEGVMHFAPYTQVFGERHGFLANLSLLDCLFVIGPQAVSAY